MGDIVTYSTQLVCVRAVVPRCFSSSELIRPPEPAKRCVTMKVTSSIPVCNVALVTLGKTASSLSCLVLAFGTADTAAETLLHSLSLNYSMKSYLLQVNVLLQNIWRAIGRTSRKDGGEIKEKGNQKIFLEISSPPLFFSLYHTWFHPRTLLTLRMNFRLPLRSPHLPLRWGRWGQLFLSELRL